MSALNGDRFDGERALQVALEDCVQVANCSWSAPPPSPCQPPTLTDVVNDAWEAGMVIVTSAGNQGSITYPGEADGLIVVGTTTPDGVTVPAESGTIPPTRPHLVAPGGSPGQEVSSSLVGGGFGPIGWGTSALLLQAEPALTPDNVRTRVLAATSRLADGSRRLDLSSW